MKKFSFIFILGGFLIAPHAHAQLPITTLLVEGTDSSSVHYADAVTAWQAQLNTIVGGSTAQIEAQAKKQAEDIAEVLAYKFAQAISKKLVAMTLNEINGGASGFDHPQQFVQDFRQLTNDLATQETKVFTDYLLASDKENPFGAAIAASLISSGVSTGLGALNSQIDKIPGVDYRYASHDISSAGIKGWDFYSLLAMPQNTPIGATQIARDTLAKNIEYAQRIKQQELTSSGYTPAKKACDVTYDSQSLLNDPAIAEAQAQLDAAQTALNVAIADGGGAPTQEQQQIINDNQHDVQLAQQALASAQAHAQSGQGNANAEYALKCANSVITNPKGAIESLGTQALTAPLRQYEKESKWYTILFDSVEQLARGLITTGLNKIPANPILNDSGHQF